MVDSGVFRHLRHIVEVWPLDKLQPRLLLLYLLSGFVYDVACSLNDDVATYGALISSGPTSALNSLESLPQFPKMLILTAKRGDLVSLASQATTSASRAMLAAHGAFHLYVSCTRILPTSGVFSGYLVLGFVNKSVSLYICSGGYSFWQSLNCSCGIIEPCLLASACQ